jgi:transcriptional regulator with XRE-family HTH domain
MDMFNPLPWLHPSVLLLFSIMPLALWRDKHQQVVNDTREVVDMARHVAGLKQSDLARDLDMDEGQLSRALRDGGNLAALVILGIRHPVFGAALVGRLGELLRGAIESPVERYERLIRELHNLPQKEPLKCEEVERQRGSSAA